MGEIRWWAVAAVALVILAGLQELLAHDKQGAQVTATLAVTFAVLSLHDRQ